ncbi:bifunctional D-glycero-beta-D-manno-heptose-7-phosphate kinase/D-glycero-beta-D-manno-heptose 1-phosphate adenylyltransferase HldE [Natronospira bacteriovora]|uniref:Bifunctional protein HldE n=1 Tax=Natronospira bacteriovora TaxID=3069753 RepID=A0ABU0W781_9GAMM|nr:bifunctional D-glycero-beta-D-manno-heptose-7-phosphate kinase/D-glycero-beta-D-manno-heptose 1-phosphate adenylyltransferase HldE [Natronospira sp. AB-CW4]MDQ2069613.1 bifunctional D-glycero-beta-D-manno-heptose-7-phosphate kinase/D-glycero-beta-D-manno-heptose 1-phosphate adenylyltransferase HldE [Natronospira sp. AB-CW4]
MRVQLPDFSKARVLVLGDVMLDRYWQGPTGRISPEAPVPVVRVENEDTRPGGAGNVALNLASLSVNSRLMGCVGDDEAAALLRAALDDAGIEHQLIDWGLPTITKLRVISRNQQLIRLDFEQPGGTAPPEALASGFDRQLDGHQVVVLSDYAKGCLSGIRALIAEARERGLPVLVDPKGHDFSRYRGASLLTPNLGEFEAVVGPCPDDATLVEKAEALAKELSLEALLVTRSEKGMSLIRPGQPPLHLPARAREVFDVTGAGDTVIAVFAAMLAAGEGMDNAARLANLAAGLVVGKLGAATVSPSELRLAMHDAGAPEAAVMDQATLVHAVRHARERGEKVVMTNGCFDILHAGHVSYLRAARALGDRLIVAVNDDDSVRRLKGDGRPVNPLMNRMSVLAGLEAVDWVVPFSEDTPERIICELLPDLLVKGGDYRPAEIAGHDCVVANGGEVRVLDFVDGLSTSDILARVRGQ